jgi:hypothetical protein
MADHTGQGADRDSFDDMKAHERTWHGFLKFIKWQIIAAIVLLLILLIWRTHN